MSRSLVPFVLLVSVCASAALTLVAACDNSSGNPSDNGNPQQDSSAPPPSTDAGVTVLPDGNVIPNDSGPPPNSDCFTNPKTHFEIINACTNAQKIAKNPNLPLLLPDGGLPQP